MRRGRGGRYGIWWRLKTSEKYDMMAKGGMIFVIPFRDTEIEIKI